MLREKAPEKPPSGGAFNAPIYAGPESRASRDFKMLCRLAGWALKFTPLVAIDKELLAAFEKHSLSSVSTLHNGLILDITGTKKVHSSEEALLQRLTRCFLRKKIEARLAIAATPGAAWALSRFSKSNCTICGDSAGQLEPALASLPVQALRLPGATIEALDQTGITRIADLLKLPRKTLTVRFGPLLIKRLKQALGKEEEPLRFAHPRRPFYAVCRFEVPLADEQRLKTALADLLKQVILELIQNKKEAALFIIELKLGQAPAQVLRKELPLFQTSASFSHLNSIIQPLIESLHIKQPVSALSVSARFATKACSKQKDLLPQSSLMPDHEAAGELFNHLTARLGANSLTRLAFRESYVPEKSFYYQPVKEPALKNSPAPPLIERPTYFFSPPQPISAIALLPDRAPVQIKWQGRIVQIVRGLGPERIGAEWWHARISED